MSYQQNIAQMILASKAYIACLLVITIKLCHMIHETDFNTVMMVAKDNSKNFWSEDLIGREQNKYTYQKRFTDRRWKVGVN